MTKEIDILFQQNNFWVLKKNNAYYVMRDGVTHAVSDSAYSQDEDGLSLAVARCKYLGRLKLC